MQALDAAFFRVGEARGTRLIEFAGGEPDQSEEETRASLERHGFELVRLETEGRFRLSPEPDTTEACGDTGGLSRRRGGR